MRILFLSNFYHPARPGGYSQWCHEVAEGLKARGHTIGVITSRHELEKVKTKEEHIYRVLHLEGDLEYYSPVQFFTRWQRRQRENLANFRTALEDFAPDLLFVWGMWAMSHTIPAYGEQLLPGRVVYYLSDYWPSAVDMHTTYWTQPAQRGFMRLPKQLLGSIALSMLTKNGRPALQLEHVLCVSAAVRDILVEVGIPIQHARIVYGGTDAQRFSDVTLRDFSHRPLQLLYAGQMVAHKGVHTALEAMVKLSENGEANQVLLSLVGSGHPAYESFLLDFIDRKGLQKYVDFRGPVPKDQMPEILRNSDILIFPSIYEEPFARMTQEAMLAGLVVVGTTTGGTKEILVENKNGLTFAAEDEDGLARQISRLIHDPEFCRCLSETGRKTVLERFTLDRMIDEIEAYLLSI